MPRYVCSVCVCGGMVDFLNRNEKFDGFLSFSQGGVMMRVLHTCNQYFNINLE